MDRDRLTLPMLVALLFSGAVTGWMGWQHVGPFRWLTELQSSLLGGRYYPALTWAVLFVVVALPLQAIARRVPVGQHIEFSRAMTYARLYPRHLQLTVVCAVGLVMGVGLLARVGLAEGFVLTTLEALETTDDHPPFVAVIHFVPDLEAVVETRGATYVPLHSERGGPIVVFAKLNDLELEALDEDNQLEGMLERDGLPNAVRVIYEDLAAEPHFVLDVGSAPGSERRFALGLLGVATALAFALSGYYLTRIAGSF